MTEINHSIEIAAPPEAIFPELTDLHRLTRWSTITETHEGPDEQITAGHEFDQSIRVAGVKLQTRWRCTECEPPHRVGYEATSPGGGRLHMRQTVEPTATGSRVQLHVDYDLPGGAIGDLLDKVYVERRNEREVEHSLQNLKDLVEGRA
ncbi:MAG: SRPBCC family protein [Actinomycetota bacterium]|nr:SRPBCC family protein [Actinomycetota bacterium]